MFKGESDGLGSRLKRGRKGTPAEELLTKGGNFCHD